MNGLAVFQQAWSRGMRRIQGFEFWEASYFTLKNNASWPQRIDKSELLSIPKNLEKHHWIVHSHNPRGGDLARAHFGVLAGSALAEKVGARPPKPYLTAAFDNRENVILNEMISEVEKSIDKVFK